MRLTATIAAASLAMLTLPGCIFVAGSSSGRSSYSGYNSAQKTQIDSIISANAQNRLGESRDVVLGRYPARYVTLVHSDSMADGAERAVYRVYAYEKNGLTTFRRYLVFENDRLALLTHDDEVLKEHCGADLTLE